MVEHHNEHGQSGHGEHGGASVGEWLNTHMSGLIMPFGARAEKFFENTMFLIVNKFFMRAAIACLAIVTPVILLEFVLHAARL